MPGPEIPPFQLCDLTVPYTQQILKLSQLVSGSVSVSGAAQSSTSLIDCCPPDGTMMDETVMVDHTGMVDHGMVGHTMVGHAMEDHAGMESGGIEFTDETLQLQQEDVVGEDESWDRIERLKMAIQAVEVDEIPCRRASRLFNLPESTVRRHLKDPEVRGAAAVLARESGGWGGNDWR